MILFSAHRQFHIKCCPCLDELKKPDVEQHWTIPKCGFDTAARQWKHSPAQTFQTPAKDFLEQREQTPGPEPFVWLTPAPLVRALSLTHVPTRSRAAGWASPRAPEGEKGMVKWDDACQSPGADGCEWVLHQCTRHQDSSLGPGKAESTRTELQNWSGAAALKQVCSTISKLTGK